MKGKNLPALITDLNKELTKWATWFRSNRLGVNVSKTKYIIFHNKGKVIDNGGLSVVFDNNEPSSPFNPALVTPLERIQSSNEPSSQYYKLLGILFDENLNFNYQISNLSSKLSKAIYFLNKTKNILPPKALKSLYFAYFHSHLLYCPIINSCTSHSNVQKIVKLQKKAIRIVAGANYSAHTDPIFKELNILPYTKIIQQAKLHFMHPIFHGYTRHLTSFNSTWQKNSQRNIPIELRNLNDFYLPRANRENFKRSPLYSLPFTWNNSGFFKHYVNPTTFKIALKSYLNSDECPINPFLTNHVDIPPPPPSPPPSLPPSSPRPPTWPYNF